MLVIGLLALAGCTGSPATGPVGVPVAPPPPPVTLELSPGSGAQAVAPADPVGAKAANGRIVNAVLSSNTGEQIPGAVTPDGLAWNAGQKLGFGKTYTLSVTAQGAAGPPVTQQTTFSTAPPGKQTYVSINPLDGQTVGVGQPLVFYFSAKAPPPDKAKAEAAIKIHTEPAVEGAFYWLDSREVHWRPKDYWQPHTKVSVDIDAYGRDFGGAWGQEDRHANITIGDAVVLKADGASHQMAVFSNGQNLRTIPIALGKPSFPSNNGIHVVTEHHRFKLMDSSTYGLPVASGGYRTQVEWAVRISNGGEFLHAAPWSVRDQGHRNVSHGCINMSTPDAEWVFNLLKKGDVVEITNSGGPDLRSWDGLGDWQVPWDEWLRGNR